MRWHLSCPCPAGETQGRAPCPSPVWAPPLTNHGSPSSTPPPRSKETVTHLQSHKLMVAGLGACAQTSSVVRAWPFQRPSHCCGGARRPRDARWSHPQPRPMPGTQAHSRCSTNIWGDFSGNKVDKNPPPCQFRGTQVGSLVQQDSTCRGTAKPVHPNSESTH